MTVPVLRCHEVEEALGAYALDALEPDEAAAISAHLSVCPRCQEAAGRSSAVVDALALLVPPVAPPVALRERLLASATDEPVAPAAPISIVERRSRRNALTAVLAACVALLLVSAAFLAVSLNRVADERDEAMASAALISSYVSAGGQVVPLSSQQANVYEGYSARGSLLVAPGKEPLVIVAGCPKSSEHLTYRVWFAREGERSAAGELWVDEDGSGMVKLSPEQPLHEFDTIGVTALNSSNEREDVLIGALPSTTLN